MPWWCPIPEVRDVPTVTWAPTDDREVPRHAARQRQPGQRWAAAYTALGDHSPSGEVSQGSAPKALDAGNAD
ncbi:hypothetical protein FRAAL1537 [Frankia alni ACN14a]|uniref:Uncharacterized protein n=1 Tax=Frankia alni (strain DSM 45986 / CECT 9034 / ACN14a) TaxID=326424 RepID=Q0RQI1_FRAAA|nr:hypothetical protein FRAAL1537 [Frankia alni ACN14a]